MTKRELLEQYNKDRMQVIDKLLDDGVEFTDLTGVTISKDAKIGKNVVIHRGTIIRGVSEIGDNCIIGPDSIIEESKIGNGTSVVMSVIEKSEVCEKVTIGPFSHLRPNCVIKDTVHIGNFVEVKNSVVDEGTKAGHLTYIGDADVGKNVNFGCGTVIANYDGVHKHRTIIGDNGFIGCNTNLIAPVTIEKNGLTAAGSTITDTVPEGAMGIARARQVNKENWEARNKNK